MSFLCVVHQAAVNNRGFPWPQQHRMAQARSVSNYASNCPRLEYIEQISLPVFLLLLPLSSSVLLVFSLSNTRQTCSRCVMCIIQATVYFVCVNTISLKLWRMFKMHVPSCPCFYLLFRLKQCCNLFEHMHSFFCKWVSWKCWALFSLCTCTHVAHRHKNHLTGALLFGCQLHFIELLKWLKFRLLLDGFYALF